MQVNVPEGKGSLKGLCEGEEMQAHGLLPWGQQGIINMYECQICSYYQLSKCILWATLAASLSHCLAPAAQAAPRTGLGLSASAGRPDGCTNFNPCLRKQRDTAESDWK